MCSDGPGISGAPPSAVAAGRKSTRRGSRPAPVEGARVEWTPVDAEEISNPSAPIVRRGWSDPAGGYRLEHLAAGPFTVTAPGHARTTIEGTLPESGVTRQDIPLERGWDLEGRVTDAQGVPIAGAEVVVAEKKVLQALFRPDASSFARRMALLVEPGITDTPRPSPGARRVRER